MTRGDTKRAQHVSKKTCSHSCPKAPAIQPGFASVQSHCKGVEIKKKWDTNIWVVKLQIFLFISPLFGEEFQFDKHISQMGWFNHQPEYHGHDVRNELLTVRENGC